MFGASITHCGQLVDVSLGEIEGRRCGSVGQKRKKTEGEERASLELRDTDKAGGNSEDF